LILEKVLHAIEFCDLCLNIGLQISFMASIFNNWSAHDIVGPLNKREVRAALLDYAIERSCFRTWDSIEKMILSSSDEVKSVLHQSGVAKARVEEEHQIVIHKRHREAEISSRNVRRRLPVG
jgi:hypothetical protein